MFAVFPLAQFQDVSWRDLFTSYHARNHVYGDDWKRYRVIEEEIGQIDYIRRILTSNPVLKMDSNALDTHEKYLKTYIGWLEVVRREFRFGTDHKNQISFSVKAECRLVPDEFEYSNPDTEIYWFSYNLACVYYAKGEFAGACRT